MDKTLILVKPDAFARGLTGEIIARFERKGLRIAALKYMQMERSLADNTNAWELQSDKTWRRRHANGEERSVQLELMLGHAARAAEGGPEDDGRARGPAARRAAGDVRGDDRGYRHRGDVADAPQGHARNERPERPLAKAQELRGGSREGAVRGGRGHRGMIGERSAHRSSATGRQAATPAGTGFSMGTPMRLPYSVQEPS